MTTTITALAEKLSVWPEDVFVLVDQLIEIDGAEATLADDSGTLLTDDAAEAITEQIKFRRTVTEDELRDLAKWHLGLESLDEAKYEPVVDSLTATAKQVYEAAGWTVVSEYHAPDNNDLSDIYAEVEGLADRVWSTWIEADSDNAAKASAIAGND